MIVPCKAKDASYALFLVMLMASLSAHASLLDCSKSSVVGLTTGAQCVPVVAGSVNGQSAELKNALPAQVANTASVGFHVDQSRAARAVPESAPLLVLFGALLAIVLVRARSCNTK